MTERLGNLSTPECALPQNSCGHLDPFLSFVSTKVAGTAFPNDSSS